MSIAWDPEFQIMIRKVSHFRVLVTSAHGICFEVYGNDFQREWVISPHEMSKWVLFLFRSQDLACLFYKQYICITRVSVLIHFSNMVIGISVMLVLLHDFVAVFDNNKKDDLH